MNYALLKLWTQENGENFYTIRELKKYDDQIAIYFRKQKRFLQLNFYPSNSFCFFTEKQILPFEQNLSTFTKLLSNFKIKKIEILPNDRIIKISLTKIDMFNQKNSLHLYIEFIPFFANLIVTNENDVIIDALKKVSIAQNPKKPIMPGMKYQTVKFNVDDKLRFPLKLKNDYFLFEKPNNINDLFETLYYEHILQDIEKRKIEQIRKKIDKKIKKKIAKLEKLQRELNDYDKVEQYKLFMELLKANYRKIKKSMSEIEVPDYYKEGYPTVKIPLNPLFNASQNLNFYAKKYKKARSGKKVVSQQIEQTKTEIEVLERLKEKAENTEFIIEIETKTINTKTESKPFKRIEVNSDWKIIFGRTKTENDFITTKVAKPQDWWFHTRIYHGTHLVLKNLNKKEPPYQLIKICAGLAAYYSKAKKSQNVPVDYTQKRYVRKPKGAPPGYVVYSHQKTIYANPIDERTAIKLLKEI